ncbi:unnamed protein product, partial [Ceratitis capitata]
MAAIMAYSKTEVMPKGAAGAHPSLVALRVLLLLATTTTFLVGSVPTAALAVSSNQTNRQIVQRIGDNKNSNSKNNNRRSKKLKQDFATDAGTLWQFVIRPMTQAAVAKAMTKPTPTPIKRERIIGTTVATAKSARNKAVVINLYNNKSSIGGRSRGSTRNNNTTASKSKHLTWYKVVSEQSTTNTTTPTITSTTMTTTTTNNNNSKQNHTYKTKTKIYSNNKHTALAILPLNEQIGNVDGNAGGNENVRVVRKTVNANKNRIRKSKNSYYSVNKIVLATERAQRRSLSRRHVNKSPVNSVNNQSGSGKSVSPVRQEDSVNAKTNSKQQFQHANNSATNVVATTTSTESIPAAHLDYIIITDYNRPRKRTFWQKY